MYNYNWNGPSVCLLPTEMVSLALNHAGSFFPVPKLCMPRLSRTGNCYQLRSNTLTGVVSTLLDTNKGERKALKQWTALLPNSQPITNRSVKQWALSSPTPCSATLKWRSWGDLKLLSLTSTASEKQTSAPFRTQEVLRHADIDTHSGSCPPRLKKKGLSSTRLKAITDLYFSLCNDFNIN
jgi:hypothetical protein